METPRKVLDREHDIISQAEAKWLIIFDNADDPDLLQDYWPLSSHGSILVTSRDPLSRITPSIATDCIQLAPLQGQEAASLLVRLSRQSKEEDLALSIASSKLGGLPLAISQMAAVIRYQYLSFSDFLEQYENDEDRRELHAHDATSPRPEARGNIATIWAIEQLQAPARTVLELCAVLDPDCIQERIFTSDKSAAGVLADLPRSSFAFAQSRADLMKRSLITRNEEKREFTVHRILQDSVLSKMAADRMLDVFSAAVSLVHASWGSTPLDKRHVLSFAKARDGLFPHALALRNMYESYFKKQNPEASIELAMLMNESGWCVPISHVERHVIGVYILLITCHDIGRSRYQHERGNSQDIKPFLHLALEICNANPGPKTSQLLADVHYGLAAAANETNDAKGCLHHTQALLKSRLEATSASGLQDIRLAVAHNEIGIAWVMNLEYERAIDDFGKSINVYRGLSDHWLSMDTNPRTNLGFTYWVLGDLAMASRTFEDLLRDRESHFGPDDKESYR